MSRWLAPRPFFSHESETDSCPLHQLQDLPPHQPLAGEEDESSRIGQEQYNNLCFLMRAEGIIPPWDSCLCLRVFHSRLESVLSESKKWQILFMSAGGTIPPRDSCLCLRAFTHSMFTAMFFLDAYHLNIIGEQR